ncbi:MAG: hypothetical protein ACLSA6_11560 [Holdemania massiliensis]
MFTLDCSACGEGRTQRHVELPNLDTLELYLDVSSGDFLERRPVQSYFTLLL